MSVTISVSGEPVTAEGLERGEVMDLANGNWSWLMDLLGCGDGEESDTGLQEAMLLSAGRLHPVNLLVRIGRVERAIVAGRVAELTRSEVVEHHESGGTMVHCGVTEEQLARYLVGLQNLAVRAIRANVYLAFD